MTPASNHRQSSSPPPLFRGQQDGAVPLGMALLVSFGVSAGAFYMSLAQTQALEARIRIDSSGLLDETGHASLARAYGLFEGGSVRIGTALTNRGQVIADATVIGPSSPGSSGWQRVSGQQNSFFQTVCARTGMVQGETLDLPAGVESALPNGGTSVCPAHERLLVTFTVEGVAEPQPGNFWAAAAVTTKWHPDAVTLDPSKGSQRVSTKFNLEIADDVGSSDNFDTCPYIDPAMNTPVKYTKDLFVGGGRYHAGWVKLGHRHTYNTVEVVPGAGWVGIRNWINRNGMQWHKHGYWVKPIEDGDNFYQNWEFEIQGGYGGWWAHNAILTIPKADPGQCHWTIWARRRPGVWSGCFASGTKITMADGSTKAVETIVAGETVRNPLTGLARPVTRVTTGPEERSLIRVVVGGQSVDVSEQHPFLVRKGIARADELQIGTEVRVSAGSWAEVESVSRLPPVVVPVWNIALGSWEGRPDDHYVLANGVPTGDLHLQESLEHVRNHAVPVKESPPTTEEVRQALALWFGVTERP